jgi:hypothetical protein
MKALLTGTALRQELLKTVASLQTRKGVSGD